MVSLFPNGEISYKVSLFLTSIALNIGSISLGIIFFIVLLLVMMEVLLLILLLEVLPSVNSESLIFSFSSLLLSCYESRFFLCEFFSELDERDQFPSCADSLNE